MTFEMFAQPKDQELIINQMYEIFSYIFIAEAVFKIYVLSFAIYLKSAWNQ